jgi:hypothetical protein
MEPPDQSDTASEAPGIQGQCLSCLRRGAKQEVVASLLVTTCHCAEFSRECEGHHEVRAWPQHTLLVFQPCLGVAMLALGTMPVLTGVVAVMVVSAFVTGLALAAKRLSAALLNGVQGAKRRGEQPVANWSAVVGAMAAEEVSYLDPHRALMRRVRAGDPSASALTVRGGSRLVVVGEEGPLAFKKKIVCPSALIEFCISKRK